MNTSSPHSIWSTDENGAWRLLSPKGFPDEATLHTMVEQAPQMLPLSGSPTVTVVGREVQLGSGYADLLAIEPDGRLVVIEVKLAKNAEARRAVVAQVLTYAAFLRGMEPGDLEERVLKKQLSDRGYASLTDAVKTNDQAGSFNEDTFAQGLRDSLSQGRFRLVIVLDQAPAELVRLVGYLEAVTQGLVIDLITVSAYEVNAGRVIVPQRIDPEKVVSPFSHPSQTSSSPKVSGEFTEGADVFLAAIAQAPDEERARLKQLADWAQGLEVKGLASLGTLKGVANRWTLLPRLPDDQVGLVTLWNEKGAYIQFWRSVFLRRAPLALLVVESLIAPATVGKGTTTKLITTELLEALTAAYEEAAAGIVLKG